MNFGVNIDICIARTAAPFPNILRNLMINDYLRGLQGDRRVGPQDFLEKFADEASSNRVKATRAHNRILSQEQSKSWLARDGAENYDDPRGVPLAYSGWCNRWYLGTGRIKSIIDCLFVHASLAKELIAEKRQRMVPKIWTRDLEEDIIRSVVSTIKTGAKRKEDSDEAVAFYMRARRSDSMGAMLKTWREHIFGQWAVDVVHAEDIEAFDDSTGVRFPAVIKDNFFDNQAGYLISWFGDSGVPGHEHELWKACPGFLFQRAFLESVGELQELAQVEGTDFDYNSTFVSDFVGDGCYSFVVCCAPLIELDDLPHTTLDASMQALEGIALLNPNQPCVKIKDVLESLGAENFKNLTILCAASK